MSRIGKKPIEIPEGVKVKIEGQKVIVEGPKGKLEREFEPEVDFKIEDKKIIVFPQKQTKRTKALRGTTRQIIYNMVEGVTKGFEKKLEIHGLGYKASLKGKKIVLEVGFSHPVEIEIPDDISVSVEKNIISVSGIDKEKVGNFAAKIRAVKPAKKDPYKGKGIKYVGEKIRRKVPKKMAMAK